MYCNNCGQEIKDDEMFCPNCGKEVKRKNQSTPEEKEMVQPAVKKEKGKISPVNKVIATVSSILLFISIYFPFLTAKYGSMTVNSLFGRYTIVMVILILCIVVFLIFQFTNHRKLSVIGLAGIWIWTLCIGFLLYAAISRAAAMYGTGYTLNIGLWLYLIGLLGQFVALVMPSE